MMENNKELEEFIHGLYNALEFVSEKQTENNGVSEGEVNMKKFKGFEQAAGTLKIIGKLPTWIICNKNMEGTLRKFLPSFTNIDKNLAMGDKRILYLKWTEEYNKVNDGAVKKIVF